MSKESAPYIEPTPEPKEVWAVIAAGGTAGHIFPALVVAREIRSRGLDVHIVGTKRGLSKYLETLENTSEFDEKFAMTFFEGRGLSRKLNFKSILHNFYALVEFFSARRKAKKLLKILKPQVVLSTGGYAGLPCGFAAKSLKVPLVLMEANVTPGIANKKMSRFAKASAIGFPDCKLPNARYVGNPVREEILSVNRKLKQSTAKANLGIDGFLVVVVGGSLGSKKLNSTVIELAKDLGEYPDLNIYHIVGSRDWNWYSEQIVTQQKNLKAVEFESNMAELYEAADLFISRAGAGVLAELAATAMPSILIPLGNAPGDHQMANAQAFLNMGKKPGEELGAAVILTEKDLNAKYLMDEISKYMSNPDLLEKLLENVKIVSAKTQRNSAKSIVDLMEMYAVKR